MDRSRDCARQNGLPGNTDVHIEPEWPTMLLGLGASLTGVLLFAAAPNVSWIFVGRAFMRVGVGRSAEPSAAAMVEFSPPGQKHPDVGGQNYSRFPAVFT